MTAADPRSGVDTALRALQFASRAASLSQQAAEHAARTAALQEQMVGSLPSADNLHERLAALHRRNERCQRAAERMHEAFARRLETWLERQIDGGAEQPHLMSAVATTTGWQGAVLTLYSHDGAETLVAASDAGARRAHQLEVILAEGPSWDAAHGREAAESDNELYRHWPRYGSAVARMGVRAVAAVPLDLDADDLRGSLTVTGLAPPSAPAQSYGLRDVANALTRTVLRAPELVHTTSPDLPRLEMFEDDDFQPVLHQAAGVLHERCGWTIDNAISLIRAHAFAEDRPVEAVAAEVVRGSLLMP